MDAAATTTAAAPVRPYKPRKNSLAKEVLEYCVVPRDMAEIVDWLGEPANAVTRTMAARGQLVNMRPARGIGVYVDAKRVPLHVEQIVWYAPDAGQLDDEITVLLSVEAQDEVHDGYRCAGTWYYATSGAPITKRVIAWAHKPVGPAA